MNAQCHETTLTVKSLIINIAMHMVTNMISYTIIHMTLNTIIGVIVYCLLATTCIHTHMYTYKIFIKYMYKISTSSSGVGTLALKDGS